MKRKTEGAAGKKKDYRVLLLVLTIVAILVVWSIPFLFFDGLFSADEPETTPSTVTEPTTLPETTAGTTAPVAETTEPTEPVMLPDMAELYAKNPDIIAWLTIAGTNVDYPLMCTPEDEEKYLYRNFEEKYDLNGLPFMETDCSLDPESTNLIFYGHNMLSGAMFRDLLKYESESFWREHKTLTLKTLYEERTYEIIGAFRDHVYYSYEDVFKFYKFIDPATQEEFDEAIAHYKEHTPYDMGVEANYGDHLITLVTCAYHHEYGRYVVVAREITEDNALSTAE